MEEGVGADEFWREREEEIDLKFWKEREEEIDLEF
jgi:hypothetical protein